jgi:hypothetical protein
MTPDPPIRPRLLAVIGGSDGQRYSARVRSFISPRRPVRARRLRRTHRGAGFTFALGEQSFADDAVVVSGTVTSATPAQVQSTLVGSYLGDSIRVITPDVAEIEIVFSDNTIINGPGTDLVIFELSGSGPAGRLRRRHRKVRGQRTQRIRLLAVCPGRSSQHWVLGPTRRDSIGLCGSDRPRELWVRG